MPAEALSVLIIDADPAGRAAIRQALSGVAHILAETDSLVYGYELLRQNRPQMAFIDLRSDPYKTLETIQRISTYFKEVLIVASGDIMDLNLVKACMEAGVRDFMTRPLQPSEVRQVFDKHQPSLAIESGQGDQTGRIVSIFSNKGGLGKTTIAVNLALALSEAVGKPVALVDLNLQLGDITTFLNLEPKQTIVDIARNIVRVDAAYLESSLDQYITPEAKLYVLADPLHMEEAEDVTADQINAVLTVLRATFEYVVIDIPATLDPKTLTALDLADHILLVSMVNLPCIRSSQRLLNLFERLGYDPQKVKLVLNRYLSDDEITVTDVEETLEHPVYWKIPNNYHAAISSINRGVPVSQVEHGATLAANFMDLARKLSGALPHGGLASISDWAETPLKDWQKMPKGILGGLFGKR